MNDVLMPKLGDIMEEGTVVSWKKAVGERISAGDVLLEVEIDKGIVDVPSDFDGVVREILVAEGQTVPIGALLARIG